MTLEQQLAAAQAEIARLTALLPPQPAGQPTHAHDYLSTACWHEANDGDPDLHAACRATCKTCDAPCGCTNHPSQDDQPAPLPWVDQARDVAQQLLATLGGIGPELRVRNPELFDAITNEPSLFWLRGEVQPPGQWTPKERM